MITVFATEPEFLVKERIRQIMCFISDGVEPTLKDSHTSFWVNFLKDSEMVGILRDSTKVGP